MHYQREINYYDLDEILIFFQHRNVYLLYACSILQEN